MTEFWAKVAAHTYPFKMSYVEPIKHFSPQHAAVLYGKPVVAGESYTGYGLYSDAPFDLKPYGDLFQDRGGKAAFTTSPGIDKYDMKPHISKKAELIPTGISRPISLTAVAPGR